MWHLADFPTGCCISPVFPANGWAFDIPADAKRIHHHHLLWQGSASCLNFENEQGVYDKALPSTKIRTLPNQLLFSKTMYSLEKLMSFHLPMAKKKFIAICAS